MKLSELARVIKRKMMERPDLKDELSEIYLLAADEVADGSSEENETEIAMAEIEEIMGE